MPTNYIQSDGNLRVHHTLAWHFGKTNPIKMGHLEFVHFFFLKEKRSSLIISAWLTKSLATFNRSSHISIWLNKKIRYSVLRPITPCSFVDGWTIVHMHTNYSTIIQLTYETGSFPMLQKFRMSHTKQEKTLPNFWITTFTNSID